MSGNRRQTDTLPTCMNCGSVLYGAFCSQCGQRTTERISLRGSLRHTLRRLRRLDFRWARTAAALTIDPGRMVRRYLRGRRLPYVGPLGYSLGTTTLFVVVVLAFGLDLSAPGTPWSGVPQVSLSASGSWPVQVLTTPAHWVFALCAFAGLLAGWLTAAIQLQLHRGAGYSVTETYVFGLYVFGHLALHQTLFAVLGAFASSVGLLALAVVVVVLLAFALAGLYRQKLVRALPAALLLATVQVAGIFVLGSLARLAF